ncbi:sensor histidine kinase [Sphingomonas kyeonggiensis]|uniref:histidine kinase n=1 Tax=Sphingomonas kyeonggiensis TaxID=1268553 RepID=A0A7W6JT71_9SPHN|nr:ATP-binding protein [Sphingomonas kyeonggiensis]MBB4097985.1 PAS domain S-box-containing protein [Sphingomonas kyeonggiensis]
MLLEGAHHLGGNGRSDSDECDDLRACINDLVGLLALRSLWDGADLARLGELLADVLTQMLGPDFITVRLFDADGGAIDCQRCGSMSESAVEKGLRAFAHDWLQGVPRIGICTFRNEIEGKPLNLAALDLGTRSEFGLVLVGSVRENFPTATERLLLNVAASQALIALQQRRLLDEQADYASQLDGLVARRTHELELASEALRRSEALMAQAQRVSLTGSFAWCPSSDFLQWSAQTHRLFGVAADEPVSTELFYSRVHPDDHEMLRGLGAVARAGTTDLDCMFRVVASEGDTRIIHLVAHPVHNASEAVEYIGALQDVTARVRAEEEGRSAEIRMRELRDDLSRANRLATLGQLSATISHDVRQPLSSVVATAMAGLNWLNRPSPDVPAARRSLERAMAGAQRAADILERMKSFSRHNGQKGHVDLNKLIDDTVALVGSDARRRGVELVASLAPDLPTVNADRVQIQQVVMNLIVNAVEAVETSSANRREIAVGTWSAGGEVGVEVRDTGAGISETIRPRLFQAFNTTKPSGLGIGLSICREILEDHSGHIWATENEPVGAVFRFTLPAEPADALTQTSPVPTPIASGPPPSPMPYLGMHAP